MIWIITDGYLISYKLRFLIVSHKNYEKLPGQKNSHANSIMYKNWGVWNRRHDDFRLYDCMLIATTEVIRTEWKTRIAHPLTCTTIFAGTFSRNIVFKSVTKLTVSPYVVRIRRQHSTMQLDVCIVVQLRSSTIINKHACKEHYEKFSPDFRFCFRFFHFR